MNEIFKIMKENDSLFENMGFREAEAKELQLRSFLMNILMRYIKQEGIPQREAAKRFKTTPARINSLVHGKIDLFKLNTLFAMLENIGFKIYENIQLKAKDLFQYHDANIFAPLPKSTTNNHFISSHC